MFNGFDSGYYNNGRRSFLDMSLSGPWLKQIVTPGLHHANLEVLHSLSSLVPPSGSSSNTRSR